MIGGHVVETSVDRAISTIIRHLPPTPVQLYRKGHGACGSTTILISNIDINVNLTL
jgi:hypothetical protein